MAAALDSDTLALDVPHPRPAFMARLFVNNLTALDFSYLDSDRGVVGESLRVHVELGGNLDAQGMVLDFGDVKRQVKQTLDQHFDHRLLVPQRSAALQIEEADGEMCLCFSIRDGSRITHSSPSQAVALIDTEAVDPQAITHAAKKVLRGVLPASVTRLQLQLEPESISGPYFHYTHGLKRHAGNCQRIAHGHRSRLEIYRDEQRDPALEKVWAKRWQDIYIGSYEDISEEDVQRFCFGYESAQGAFTITIPRHRCYLLETDSTIELIAQHMADRVAAEHPGERIRARVFEGIDKGADGLAG